MERKKMVSMPDYSGGRKSLSSSFCGERSKTFLRPILDDKKFGIMSTGTIFWYYGVEQ